MQYLVTAEWIDPMGNIPSAPKEFAQVIDQAVVPSAETLAKLTAEKKILAGGVLSGERAIAFVVEASSNDEATELVHSVPFWIFMKWKVTPLESFQHHAAFASQVSQSLKAASL
jgi:muconolactone delta-isomerase